MLERLDMMLFDRRDGSSQDAFIIEKKGRQVYSFLPRCPVGRPIEALPHTTGILDVPT